MACSNCGSRMTSSRENYKYNDCGLDYVTLVNVEIRRCANCGESEVVIPNLEDLHRVLARLIAKRAGRLRGREIRFLRKFLGFSRVDAAEALMVTAETMSRWENDKRDIGDPYQALLRHMVFNRRPAESYPEVDRKRKPAAQRPGPIRLKKDSVWHQPAS